MCGEKSTEVLRAYDEDGREKDAHPGTTIGHREGGDKWEDPRYEGEMVSEKQ